MGSDSGCWPVWGDLHAGVNNATLSTGRTLDRIAKALGSVSDVVPDAPSEYHTFLGAENGYTTFQPFAGTGHTTMNILEPSGFNIQIGGVYESPPVGTDIDWGNFEGYCFTARADGVGDMQFTCSPAADR